MEDGAAEEEEEDEDEDEGPTSTSRFVESTAFWRDLAWPRCRQAQNSDGKGWQNSIRHNLSINAAFAKCDCKSSGPQETTYSTNLQ
ncbi:hypothetical protein F5Y10DRAFT_246670 [Nemania abortiva]|nr:hypothetical protein F5Y10DRAFT_246670 [Nemania abortiva]